LGQRYPVLKRTILLTANLIGRGPRGSGHLQCEKSDRQVYRQREGEIREDNHLYKKKKGREGGKEDREKKAILDAEMSVNDRAEGKH